MTSHTWPSDHQQDIIQEVQSMDQLPGEALPGRSEGSECNGNINGWHGFMDNKLYIPFQDHKLPKFDHFCTFQFKGKLRISGSWIHKEHPRTIKNKVNHPKHIDLWCQTFSWQAAWWWSQPAAGPVAWHCRHRSETPQLPVCKGKPKCSTGLPIMDVNSNSRK